jgi:hypothetical protein
MTQTTLDEPTASPMARLARLSARKHAKSETVFETSAQQTNGALYRVHVASGMHAGAAIDLPDGVFKLGDDINADIFLIDIGGDVVELRLQQGRAQLIGVDAVPAPLPRQIQVGSVALNISGGPPPQSSESPGIFNDAIDAPAIEAENTQDRLSFKRGHAAFPMILGLGGLFALGAVGVALVTPVDKSDTRQYANYMAEREIVNAPSLGDPSQDAVSSWVRKAAPMLTPLGLGEDGFRLKGGMTDLQLQSFQKSFSQEFSGLRLDDRQVYTPVRIEAALRQRLQESDVSGEITIEWRRGDSQPPTLIATGALSSDRYRFWRDVRQWFNARFDGYAILESRVRELSTARQAAPRIALEAIWTGSDPYIVTADGRRTRPGEVLPNGWRVLSISPGELSLGRDGQRERIQLPGAEIMIQ